MTTAIARLRAYRARLLARGQVMQAEVVERCIRQLQALG